MMRLFNLFILLFSLSAPANEFKSLASGSEKINCLYDKDAIVFSAVKRRYPLYDKNLSSISALKCERVKIKNFEFVTVLFSAEINEKSMRQKILIYEVALITDNLGPPKTVRSEIVDQVDLSGDPVDLRFQHSLVQTWGLNKKEDVILLKMQITGNGTATAPYFLKFNQKSVWFENIFN